MGPWSRVRVAKCQMLVTCFFILLLGLSVATMVTFTYFGAHFAVIRRASLEKNPYQAVHQWAFSAGLSLVGLLTLGAVLSAAGTVREAQGLMAGGFLCFSLAFCAQVQLVFWRLHSPTQVEDAMLDTYDLVYEQAMKGTSHVGRQELAAIQDTVSALLLSSFLWFAIRSGCSLDRKGQYTLAPRACGRQPQEPSAFRRSQGGPAHCLRSEADAIDPRRYSGSLRWLQDNDAAPGPLSHHLPAHRVILLLPKMRTLPPDTQRPHRRKRTGLAPAGHSAPPPPNPHRPGLLRRTRSAPTAESAQPGLQRRTPKVSWVPHLVTAQGLWCWAFPPLPSSARRCSTTYGFNVKGSTNDTSNTQSPWKEKGGRKVSSVLVKFRHSTTKAETLPEAPDVSHLQLVMKPWGVFMAHILHTRVFSSRQPSSPFLQGLSPEPCCCDCPPISSLDLGEWGKTWGPPKPAHVQ
ncbi:tetraspanin-32 isoform X5 [Macaca nemestrina]|uniref:tetraspanin-32 isoform X5 n=1 Tax=Macaca nemestrina TaxID=9545 RepID=UPI0039B8E5DE